VRRIPVVARLATDSRTPALVAGSLVERRGRAGRRLAGHLLPQPEVVVDGRPRRLDDVLGPGQTEVGADGDRLRVRRADGTEVVVDDPGGALLRWLRHGRARTVTVRPDRIVRSARPGFAFAATPSGPTATDSDSGHDDSSGPGHGSDG
jgi:3-(3-hydroxy-phenyl)propionate hydroxylase